MTHLQCLQKIRSNIDPHINVETCIIESDGFKVLCVQTQKSPTTCATKRGMCLKRHIGPDGKPQNMPYLPREQATNLTSLNAGDFSNQTISNYDFSCFDPLNFERLRRRIKALKGDQILLSLTDEELSKALRLVESQEDGTLKPKIAGLLLLGKEECLREFLPHHAVHFQVFSNNGDLKVNDTFYSSILHIMDEIEQRFGARNEEKEVIIGLTRIPVPDYSSDGFREAFNNTLLHRDYSTTSSIYIQWHEEHMLISSPGSLPDGVTIKNILTHEPKPRNLLLAEAFKRIGIVEQSGRGVDKIFLGQARYGRPLPDYSNSDLHTVRVIIYGGEASLNFTSFLYKKANEGVEFSINELLILNELYIHRRIILETAQSLIQSNKSFTLRILEKLVETGLIEGDKEGDHRVYFMSGSAYKAMGLSDGYVRTTKETESLIIQIKSYLHSNGTITKSTVLDLLKIGDSTAKRLLKTMVESGDLDQVGKAGRHVHYVLSQTQEGKGPLSAPLKTKH